MLTTVIHVADAIRNMLKKLAHTGWVVIESFREAQEIRRRTPRLHIDD